MADWYGVPLRRLLASADRLSESAIRRGFFSVNTPAFRSSALLFRVTSADHLWGLFLLREVWDPLFDRVLGFRDINDQPLCLKAALPGRLYDRRSSSGGNSSERHFRYPHALQVTYLDPRAFPPPRLKNCTARSCFSASSRVSNVPRFRRLPVFGSTFLE